MAPKKSPAAKKGVKRPREEEEEEDSATEEMPKKKPAPSVSTAAAPSPKPKAKPKPKPKPKGKGRPVVERVEASSDDESDSDDASKPGWDPKKVQVLGEEKMAAPVKALLGEMLNGTNGVFKCPGGLNGQAGMMRGRVRKLLSNLGRLPPEDGMENRMEIDLSKPISKLTDAQEFKVCGADEDPKKTFKMSGRIVKGLVAQAEVTYLQSEFPTQKEIDQFFKAKKSKEGLEDLAAQCVAVSGPVYAIFNNECRPHATSSKTFYCVSIPGINFAYSKVDRKTFVQENREKKQLTVNDAGYERMKAIWGHILEVFKRKKVEYPCLCAIGCGAFKGKVRDVPTLWAKSLYECLADTKAKYGFKAVIVSLPTFGEDNFSVFRGTFNTLIKQVGPVEVPTVLMENRGMVTVADWLSRNGKSAGILNPSDCQAIREGYMGMYWDEGHVALEEILAMQTTLLLQHKGINPKLFEDPKRRHPIKL